MREAFASDRAAQDGQAGPTPSGNDLSLKPGETMTIKLGKVSLEVVLLHQQVSEKDALLALDPSKMMTRAAKCIV